VLIPRRFGLLIFVANQALQDGLERAFESVVLSLEAAPPAASLGKAAVWL